MMLFVAPLRKELELFAAALRREGYRSTSSPIGRIGAEHFPELGLAVAHGGHGKTQFGVQTQHLLDHATGVAGVICVGAAGALAEQLAVGDLVLASETVEHDYTERFNPHPLPRFPGDPLLLNALGSLPSGAFPFAVHMGIVASGDEDVIELERGAALRRATEACAVAWEGAGGARAARFNSLPFLELRGVTDTADHNASSDFYHNLEAAMNNAATLVAAWRRAAAT